MGALSLFLLLSACTAPLDRYEMAQPEMGTLFRVVLYAPDEATAKRAADAAFARIQQLNATLSDYLPESELSRLSATAGSGTSVPVGDDLWEMLTTSQSIAARTDGAFDITVGPLVDLWRKARKAEKLPAPGEIEGAMRAVGHEKILLDAKRRAATLTASNMKLDLGGIAKGFAAHEALGAMRRAGVKRAMVVGGGDVAAGDAPPGRDGWAVAVRPFGESDGKNVRHLLLKNGAVSTSGDLFQSVEIGGVRYSHIVDPATGVGLTRPLAVTVVVPLRSGGGTMSDAYATALSVLGVERGLVVIEKVKGAAAIFAVRDGEGPVQVIESRRAKSVAPHENAVE